MAFSIFAADNEFAVSTGANVNSGGDRSDFDYPPTSSINLVVTTNDGDTDPRLFEIGDTYDLSFGGAGGSQTIEDATVLRSDMAEGGGGIIVFEGLDQAGSLTQVVWTPGFDLQSWYFNNFTGGIPPQFFATDQNAAYVHEFVCFAAETRIATPLGARRVDEIQPGDAVITLDRGARPVVWVGRRRVKGYGANAPVEIATGVLGNTGPLRLSQQHMVLWYSVLSELLFAAQEVLIPVRALVDGRNVRLRPCADITYVHLMLDRHELLIAEGAVCESLLRVPSRIGDDGPDPGQRTARPVLTYHEARIVTGVAARQRTRDPALL